MKCPPLLPGCGTQHPLRALGGTRVLLAAAPTTPPCFRHWRRSSSLQRKNYFNFRDSGVTAFVERSVAMKAPVGLLSGRAVCVSRWRGFAPTSSADAPLSHFHGWGRNGKRHLQRLLPAEAAALRGIPSYTTQQGRSANAGRPCCAYWKGSIGRWQLLFRQTQLFQPVPCADDLYLGHTLVRARIPAPLSACNAVSVFSVPQFTRFGRFWARIAPQMR